MPDPVKSSLFIVRVQLFRLRSWVRSNTFKRRLLREEAKRLKREREESPDA